MTEIPMVFMIFYSACVAQLTLAITFYVQIPACDIHRAAVQIYLRKLHIDIDPPSDRNE